MFIVYLFIIKLIACKDIFKLIEEKHKSSLFFKRDYQQDVTSHSRLNQQRSKLT